MPEPTAIPRVEGMDNFWDFLWIMISIFIFTAYLIVMAQIVIDLFRDPESSGLAKAGWVLLLILLPVVTALVYLALRGEQMSARNQVGYGRAPSPTDEIYRAKGLLDSGAIQPDEYAQIKARAIA